MTNMNNLDADDRSSPLRNVARMAGVVLILLLAVFMLGLIAGVLASAVERGEFSAKGAGVLAGAVIGAVACVWGAWKLRPHFNLADPVSKKTRKARWAMIASGVLGGLIGVVLSLSELQTGQSGVFSNGPLPPLNAMLAAGALVLLVPLMSYVWQSNADEFERGASGDGAIVGMYVYSIIAPAWWILDRADLVPPQQPMIVFLVVVAVWATVWIIRKAN